MDIGKGGFGLDGNDDNVDFEKVLVFIQENRLHEVGATANKTRKKLELEGKLKNLDENKKKASSMNEKNMPKNLEDKTPEIAEESKDGIGNEDADVSKDTNQPKQQITNDNNDTKGDEKATEKAENSPEKAEDESTKISDDKNADKVTDTPQKDDNPNPKNRFKKLNNILRFFQKAKKKKSEEDEETTNGKDNGDDKIKSDGGDDDKIKDNNDKDKIKSDDDKEKIKSDDDDKEKVKSDDDDKEKIKSDDDDKEKVKSDDDDNIKDDDKVSDGNDENDKIKKKNEVGDDDDDKDGKIKDTKDNNVGNDNKINDNKKDEDDKDAGIKADDDKNMIETDKSGKVDSEDDKKLDDESKDKSDINKMDTENDNKIKMKNNDNDEKDGDASIGDNKDNDNKENDKKTIEDDKDIKDDTGEDANKDVDNKDLSAHVDVKDYLKSHLDDTEKDSGKKKVSINEEKDEKGSAKKDAKKEIPKKSDNIKTKNDIKKDDKKLNEDLTKTKDTKSDIGKDGKNQNQTLKEKVDRKGSLIKKQSDFFKKDTPKPDAKKSLASDMNNKKSDKIENNKNKKINGKSVSENKDKMKDKSDKTSNKDVANNNPASLQALRKPSLRRETSKAEAATDKINGTNKKTAMDKLNGDKDIKEGNVGDKTKIDKSDKPINDVKAKNDISNGTLNKNKESSKTEKGEVEKDKITNGPTPSQSNDHIQKGKKDGRRYSKDNRTKTVAEKDSSKSKPTSNSDTTNKKDSMIENEISKIMKGDGQMEEVIDSMSSVLKSSGRKLSKDYRKQKLPIKEVKIMRCEKKCKEIIEIIEVDDALVVHTHVKVASSESLNGKKAMKDSASSKTSKDTKKPHNRSLSRQNKTPFQDLENEIIEKKKDDGKERRHRSKEKKGKEGTSSRSSRPNADNSYNNASTKDKKHVHKSRSPNVKKSNNKSEDNDTTKHRYDSVDHVRNKPPSNSKHAKSKPPSNSRHARKKTLSSSKLSNSVFDDSSDSCSSYRQRFPDLNNVFRCESYKHFPLEDQDADVLEYQAFKNDERSSDYEKKSDVTEWYEARSDISDVYYDSLAYIYSPFQTPTKSNKNHNMTLDLKGPFRNYPGVKRNKPSWKPPPGLADKRTRSVDRKQFSSHHSRDRDENKKLKKPLNNKAKSGFLKAPKNEPKDLKLLANVPTNSTYYSHDHLYRKAKKEKRPKNSSKVIENRTSQRLPLRSASRDKGTREGSRERPACKKNTCIQRCTCLLKSSEDLLDFSNSSAILRLTFVPPNRKPSWKI